MTLTLGSTRIQIAAAGERLVIAIGPGALADALRPARSSATSRSSRPRRRMLGDGLQRGLLRRTSSSSEARSRGLGGGAAGELLARVARGLTQAVGGGTQDGDTSHVEIVAGLRAR